MSRIIRVNGNGYTEFFKNDNDIHNKNAFSVWGFKRLDIKCFKDLTNFCDIEGTDVLGGIFTPTFEQIYLSNK